VDQTLSLCCNVQDQQQGSRMAKPIADSRSHFLDVSGNTSLLPIPAALQTRLRREESGELPKLSVTALRPAWHSSLCTDGIMAFLLPQGPMTAQQMAQTM
jgi:hypothetical protein